MQREVWENVLTTTYLISQVALRGKPIFGANSPPKKRASYASYLATVEAQKAVQSEVVATLATAYYQLLMLDEQKKVLEQTIEFRTKSLETTKQLKNAGSTTEVATKQIEALVYNAQAQLITINNSVWALENTICVLLGEEPHHIERSTLAEQQFPTEFKQGYAVSLLENRPGCARANSTCATLLNSLM